MNAASPTEFIRNPAVDIRVVESDAEGPLRIVVSAYSAMRGFTQTALSRDGGPAFAAILDLAAARDDVLGRLTPEIGMDLWGSGAIILPPEAVEPFAPSRFVASAAAAFAADSFVAIEDCLSSRMIRLVAAHYKAQVESGAALLSQGNVDRRQMHNDPAGRVVQRALLPAVEALVGAPLKPSYSYASLYREGAALPVHTDRPQCQFTLSLLIDYRPAPADGISPWALRIYPRHDAAPLDLFQRIGGGVLFRGRELAHGRPALPTDQTCWTLLAHYVDIDFEGTLD